MSQKQGPTLEDTWTESIEELYCKNQDSWVQTERNSNIHLGTMLWSYIHSGFFKILLWQFYKFILTPSIFTPKFPSTSFTHFQKGLKLNLQSFSWNQVFQRAFWAWPCSDSTDTPVVTTGSLCPAVSARTHAIQVSTKSGKFSTFQKHPLFKQMLPNPLVTAVNWQFIMCCCRD